MAKVFVNQTLDFSKEVLWEAQNGRTRRTLVVVNKIPSELKVNQFEGQLGFLDKGNHSFIFINEPKSNDNRVLGLFLNNEYSYDLIEGHELYSSYSQGGYGNSCSKFGVYTLGTILEVHTYKNRNTPSYRKLTENGWEYLTPYEVPGVEIKEV